jgi:23S rRNA pseudouridine1911/1915/1917 synthase
MPPLRFLVDRKEKGKTLAAVLHGRLGLPWQRVKKMIEGRHVRVGGQVEANTARRVRPGIRVEVSANVLDAPAKEKKPATGQSPRKVQPVVTAPKVKAAVPIPDGLELVYSDESVVVVNKPAGITTMRHAEEAAEFGSRGKTFLPKTAMDFVPKLLGAPNRKLFAVHRIDRDTSGLVVFARTPEAAAKLTAQFRKHTTERTYLALVRGRPANGRIESTLVEDRGDGRRGTGTGETAKKAVTYARVVEAMGEYSAVECRLETGRTHQVRIHLGEAGAPLCGERVYDRPIHGQPKPDGSGAIRPMLHAATLGFRHPETDEDLRWEAKPPADFSALWVKLRK